MQGHWSAYIEGSRVFIFMKFNVKFTPALLLQSIFLFQHYGE
uniref:Uncharacterized protein n=1 Tax=Anguilla anguilla TaxID=7936 RepID=A0A0E9W0X3_ANGAN